ncbi:MAG: hypothetical protein ACRBBN_15520 [Methyloligellaceae bacterium]
MLFIFQNMWPYAGLAFAIGLIIGWTGYEVEGTKEVPDQNTK